MRSLCATHRVIVGAVVLCIALVLVGIAAALWLTAGVKVVVTNKAGVEVKNIEVKFTGGSVTIPAIKPGAAYRTTVKPTGESHLDLRFTDSSGKDRREIIGVYFEPGYRGEIFIGLAPDGSVSFEDKTHLPGW